MMHQCLILAILDGFGISESAEGNAIAAASTPNLDEIFTSYPTARLKASGEAVGLPEGQMGNSEVGHLNLGAGRIVYQDLLRINNAIEDGSFYQNSVLLSAIRHAKEHNSALHLMGLVSDGGVHSHNTHLYALLKLAQEQGLSKVYIHAFLDGRDAGPRTADRYLRELEEYTRSSGGRVATISGRYYAMDRDHRWERIKKAYDAIVLGRGRRAGSVQDAIQQAYAAGETDEFVVPTVITDDTAGEEPVAVVSPDDAVIFFNFRADRARELTKAFIEEDFNAFEREYVSVFFVSMTEYDKTFQIPVAFPPEMLINTLAEVLSREGLRQLHIAETEKYAHVTFFFNGGREEPYPGEERILVPSPRVSTYDLKPEMSAVEVTDKVVEAVVLQRYDVIILNYANCDMVGHTGDFQAAVKAVEAVDGCIGRLLKAVRDTGSIMVFTSDHGNAEQMRDSSRLHTAHTSNQVPVCLVGEEGCGLRDGILADVAPTILELLGLEIPGEMTAHSLLL